MDPRAILDAVVKRKIPSPRRESNPRIPIIQSVVLIPPRFFVNSPTINEQQQQWVSMWSVNNKSQRGKQKIHATLTQKGELTTKTATRKRRNVTDNYKEKNEYVKKPTLRHSSSHSQPRLGKKKKKKKKRFTKIA
jgi:hypothetical protein